MSLLKKIARLAGLPDISQKKLREFMAATPEVGLPGIGDELSLALVIPCYGHARFLAAMLQSITSQTIRPAEVIFVDDCSPDESGTILRDFLSTMAATDPRYSLLSNEHNLGQTASLNRAIAAAGSELVMILNDDDYLMHDAVAVMTDLFRAHPEVALIGGGSVHFAAEDELAAADKTIASRVDPASLALDIRYPDDALSYRRYNDLNMTHSGSCFRKGAWQAVGGYFPDKGKRLVPFSDRDFQLRLNALFPVGVAPLVPFSFWRSTSSVDNGLDS